MKALRFTLPLLLLVAVPLVASAQGGIGINPREDMVRLRATTQDSFAVEVANRILTMQRLLSENKADSLYTMIAHNGGATKHQKWARQVMMTNEEEGTRATAIVEKLRKLFAAFPQHERKYYAVFKDADNPYGQKHLYQIEFTDGKRKQMVSFNFYPVGDQLLIGDVQ